MLGNDVDTLVSSGILQPVVLDAVPHPDHPANPGALTVLPAGGTALVGVSQDLAVSHRTLTPTDVAGYQLDDGEIARQLNSAMQLTGTPHQVNEGLWRLGQFEHAASAKFCVFLAMRVPHATTELEIMNAANGTQPILVFPKACHHDISITTIASRIPFGANDDLLRQIVFALSLQRQVNVTLWAREDLVMDPTSGKAWYRGVELTALQPDTHAFKFAAMVADAHGAVVTNQAIIQKLSPCDTSGQVPRKAKDAFKRAVVQSYKDADRPRPEEIARLFVARPKIGYALQGSAYLLP
ncbi:MAG: hypothetical protein ACR2RB_04865 [Gammaproteobacteria bacterium]